MYTSDLSSDPHVQIHGLAAPWDSGMLEYQSIVRVVSARGAMQAHVSMRS